MRHILLLLVLGTPAAARERYVIGNYEATFTLQRGTPDVRVRLDITYRVHEGPKEEGFKYVGRYEVADLRGYCDGQPIQVGLRRRRENQITWSFPPVSAGEKRVVIEFTLLNALSGSEPDGNRLAADWVGVFRVPVERAVYRVNLPGGSPARIVRGEAFTEQSPLRQKGLRVEIRPGIAEGGHPPGAVPRSGWY